VDYASGEVDAAVVGATYASGAAVVVIVAEEVAEETQNAEEPQELAYEGEN